MPPPLPLTLVHLSDIHFRRTSDSGPDDADADVRNELARDLTAMRERLSHVYGLLVTGDIAFSGKREEYELADTWLASLTILTGCPRNNIFTVPGNHDVDRTVVERNEVIKEIHALLRGLQYPDIDAQIASYASDVSGAGSLLFQPIAEYNHFAAKYGCSVASSRPYWEHDIVLNDSSVLTLRGLNSTLVSDALDDDAAHKLVLASTYATPLRQDGVEYLTLCHHPPDWLTPSAEIEDGLDNRVRIQLFGHKHRQRIRAIDNTVRVTAGATHPDRREPKWVPRYNVLSVLVDTLEDSRSLVLTVYPRVWSDQANCFVGELDDNAVDVRTFRLPLPAWQPAVVALPSAAEAVEPGLGVADVVHAQDVWGLTVQSEDGQWVESDMDRNRALAYRFLTLSYFDRISIANDLNLLNEGDDELDDATLYEAMFLRARDTHQLAALWTAVEDKHGAGVAAFNPFANKDGQEAPDE